MKTIINAETGEIEEVEETYELVAKEMNALITDDFVEKLEQLDYLEEQIKLFKKENKDKIKEIFKKYNIKTFKNDYVSITYVQEGMKKQLDMERLKADGVYDKYLMLKPYDEQIRITKKGRND